MPHHTRNIALAVLLALALPCFAQSDPDTLIVDLPDLVVRGAQVAEVRIDHSRLPAPVIERQDAGSLAELGGLLPSVRVAVNSRGDAVAMVRGAPERHVQTYLDAIPLNLPWDERVDLETIPALGVGTVEARRGLTTLLDGPGALAGSVRLLPPAPTLQPTSTLRSRAGDHGLRQAEVLHQRRAGAWSLLGAGSWRTRDGVSSPDGCGTRENSDMRQVSTILRAARPVRGTGRLGLVATAWSGEKGVPPELHLGQDARFWRYPVRERLLLGGVLDLPLHETWDLGVAVSTDLFHQEIDPRGPDRWDAPFTPTDDYEKNWDRTGFGRLRLTHWLGNRATVAAQASARYTHHRESLGPDSPVQSFAQWLASLAIESEARLGVGWTVRGGVGWDHVATPESGGKPPSPDDGALAVNLRLLKDLGSGLAVYGAANRRSRFPSLREAYSGALGRFLPNPDLGPERQDQLELGATAAGERWSFEAAAFVGKLRGGIEKVAVGSTQYQRVNHARITVPGVELVGRWRGLSALHASLAHTVLDARVDEDGIDRPAEDRPAYLSRIDVAWQPPSGIAASLETRLTGPRWSADGTHPDGLRRLPAGVTWHARVALSGMGASGGIEAYARVDNLFDQRVDDQTGLPGPGCMVSCGVSVRR